MRWRPGWLASGVLHAGFLRGCRSGPAHRSGDRSRRPLPASAGGLPGGQRAWVATAHGPWSDAAAARGPMFTLVEPTIRWAGESRCFPVRVGPSRLSVRSARAPQFAAPTHESAVSLARSLPAGQPGHPRGGRAAIGLWVGDQLEQGIVDRTASITALYVERFVEPHVESLSGERLALAAAETDRSTRSWRAPPLSERIVSLRVWSRTGPSSTAPTASLVGQTLPGQRGPGRGVAGPGRGGDQRPRGHRERRGARQRWSRLLEMYMPVRERGGDADHGRGRVLPAARRDRPRGRRARGWSRGRVVAAAIVSSACCCSASSSRAATPSPARRRPSSARSASCPRCSTQNEALSERVRTAAERTTTLNERALRRISADLHDGPGQMLSLALMRLDAPARAGRAPAARTRPRGGHQGEDAGSRRSRARCQDAMRDMRAIAAGLRMPELAPLTVAEVREPGGRGPHPTRTGIRVALAIGEASGAGRRCPSRSPSTEPPGAAVECHAPRRRRGRPRPPRGRRASA